jgi:integrase
MKRARTMSEGPRAKGKRLTTLRAFFRFCANRKWIPESPVSPDIKPPVGSGRAANKAPFFDDELHRIIKACDNVKVEWKNETGVGVWTGEDLKDLIWLMVYTGFRISDATLFDIKHLRGDQVFIRATKNGGDVFAYVPDWLGERLLARAKRCGKRPFVVAKSERLETVTNDVAPSNREGLRGRRFLRRASNSTPLSTHVCAGIAAEGCSGSRCRGFARRRRENRARPLREMGPGTAGTAYENPKGRV